MYCSMDVFVQSTVGRYEFSLELSNHKNSLMVFAFGLNPH